MNLIIKNIIANYVGKLWSIISVFIFIPIYIKILGIESYAIINFHVVLLTIMYIADAGLTASFSKEAARSDDKKYLGDLLISTERIYFFISLFVVVLIFLFSDIISDNLLQSESFLKSEISTYISLMGISIALQLYMSLYNGGLMGMQKQVQANGIQIVYGLFRSGIVIIPLYFYPNLHTFFIWQIIINTFFLFFTRNRLHQYISIKTSKFDLFLLKNIWKFAFGMMGMSLIYALNTQIDKLVVSKMLSLKDFGYYSLATTISQIPFIATLPVAVAILPQITRLTSESNKDNMRNLFHKYSYIIVSISSIITIILFSFTKEIMMIWVHDEGIVNNTVVIIKILVIGGFFLSAQLMPYHLAIAHGHVKTNLKLGIINLIIIIPLLVLLTSNYGLVGASIPWLLINLIGFIVLGYIFIPKFLTKELTRWFLVDTIIPLSISIFVGVPIYFAFRNKISSYEVLLVASLMGIIAILFNLIIYNHIYKKNKIILFRM